MQTPRPPAFISPIPLVRRPLALTTIPLSRLAPPYTSPRPPCRRSHLPLVNELTQNDIAAKSAERMAKTLDSVQSAFNTIRTGRASPAILDRVHVSYYGADTPLKQLASISVSGTSAIVIEPFDKGSTANIERALMESDLGINPNNNGTSIRLNFPPLTEDRRKQLVKQIKAMAEEGRVALRNIRRDAVDEVKKMEKKSEIGKDESKSIQDDIQKLTDKNAKQIDNLFKKKEADVMKV